MVFGDRYALKRAIHDERNRDRRSGWRDDGDGKGDGDCNGKATH